MKTRLRPQDEDTICALVTPYGKGGLSVLRVSGDETLDKVRAICPFLPKKPRSHQAYFGSLKYKEKVIDEVVALFFEENRSFTSEQTIEISCHGSPVICEEILQALQDLGCRIAERGEFTYRAFLSGKMDLVQAESIFHLIEAQSKKAKRQALWHLQGKLSEQLYSIQQKIKNLLAHTEAQLDFSEEDITILSSKEILKQICQIQEEANQLMKNYKQGVCVREGLKVGIFGMPNSGKSTLFNQLLEQERAIVSDQKGTTRDQIEGSLFFQGHKINITDTAGIRTAQDSIEKEGIKRAMECFDSSDVCFYLLDASSNNFEDARMIFNYVFSKNNEKETLPFYKKLSKRFHQDEGEVIFIINKTDLRSKETYLQELEKKTTKDFVEFLRKKGRFISSQQGQGVQELRESFLFYFQKGENAIHAPRHFLHLKEMQEHLQKIRELLESKEIPFEILSEELKRVLINVQSILGQEVSVDVLEEIFQQFCIGK